MAYTPASKSEDVVTRAMRSRKSSTDLQSFRDHCKQHPQKREP